MSPPGRRSALGESESAPGSSGGDTPTIPEGLTDRAVTIYRVEGWRTNHGARERVTQLRRTRPAAERQARYLESIGQGPVTLSVTRIAADSWREVPR